MFVESNFKNLSHLWAFLFSNIKCMIFKNWVLNIPKESKQTVHLPNKLVESYFLGKHLKETLKNTSVWV